MSETIDTINVVSFAVGGIGIVCSITLVCILCCIRSNARKCQCLRIFLLGKQGTSDKTQLFVPRSLEAGENVNDLKGLDNTVEIWDVGHVQDVSYDKERYDKDPTSKNPQKSTPKGDDKSYDYVTTVSGVVNENRQKYGNSSKLADNKYINTLQRLDKKNTLYKHDKGDAYPYDYVTTVSGVVNDISEQFGNSFQPADDDNYMNTTHQLEAQTKESMDDDMYEEYTDNQAGNEETSSHNSEQEGENRNIEKEEQCANKNSISAKPQSSSKYNASTIKCNRNVDSIIGKSASSTETATVPPINHPIIKDSVKSIEDEELYANTEMNNASERDSDPMDNRCSLYSNDSSTSSSSSSDNNQSCKDNLQSIKEGPCKSSCQNQRGCKTFQSSGVTVHNAEHLTINTKISKRVYYPNP